MALLKKIKSSTLMETLVATVLIVGVFAIASMVLNAVFRNAYTSNTNEIENHIKEIEYFIYNKKVPSSPYAFQDWEIEINEKDSLGAISYTVKAVNEKTTKEISKKIVADE